MKKLFVFVLAAGYCIAGIAHEPYVPWVDSKSGKLECKRVNIGITNARIILENGEKIILPVDEISSYSLNDKVFTKLPLFKNGQPTGKKAFMELVKTRDGLSFYRYSIYDTESNHPGDLVYRYYVYRGTKLFLELNNVSLPNVCRFFNLEYKEI